MQPHAKQWRGARHRPTAASTLYNLDHALGDADTAIAYVQRLADAGVRQRDVPDPDGDAHPGPAARDDPPVGGEGHPPLPRARRVNRSPLRLRPRCPAQTSTRSARYSGCAVEPRRRAAHAVLVVLVDELVDRALEPLERRLLEVVALVERNTGAVRAERLEPDVADLVVARRRSRSSCTCSPARARRR